MNKLLFKTLYYAFYILVKIITKLGYPAYLSIHQVPSGYVEGEVEVEATYEYIRPIPRDFIIFIKNTK